jgi:hypothetical protein
MAGVIGVEMLEYLCKGTLRGVAGIFPVAEHPERYTLKNPLVPLDQNIECRRIAGSTPVNQFGVF